MIRPQSQKAEGCARYDWTEAAIGMSVDPGRVEPYLVCRIGGSACSIFAAGHRRRPCTSCVRVHHYLQSACHLKFYRPTLPDPYPLVGNFDLLAGRKIW